jgi:hypothetical protein
MVQLNVLQKLRLLQAFYALIFCVLSMGFISGYNLPDPPPIEAFLTSNQIVQYQINQLVFFISFICLALFLGMAYQAKDIKE